MKKYQIIYADPPWTYKESGGIKSSRGLAKKQYNTMSIENIGRLPIQTISDINCNLFLWATAPRMKEGIWLLQNWGFTYFTIAFTWIKLNKKADTLFWGMGNVTRANPEYVLLGRKGKLQRQIKNIHSVVMSKIEEHSKKPDEVRNRIVSLYGDIPRIELFARQKTEGWDAIGYEINGKDIKDCIKELCES